MALALEPLGARVFPAVLDSEGTGPSHTAPFGEAGLELRYPDSGMELLS